MAKTAKSSKRTAKKTAKKTSKAKAPAPSRTSSAKRTAKKAAKKTPKPAAKRPAKNPSAKKTPAKKTAKPAATKKPASKKPASKKAAAKKPATSKTTARKTAAPAQKKPSAKKAPAKKPAAKKADTRTSASTKPAASSSVKAGDAKPKRKGITIVSKRPTRKNAARKAPVTFGTDEAPLLGPGAKRRAPLIPSGPAAARDSDRDGASNAKKRRALGKRELTKYRTLLQNKRRQLLGDLSQLEQEAFDGDRSSTSSQPQDPAEQGSGSYDTRLSLDLAAADRKLIREIDAALDRIDRGVFGVCEMTGRQINPARLSELPWTRYSIEAARAMERRGGL